MPLIDHHCQSGVFFMERKGFSPAILFVRVRRIDLTLIERIAHA